MQCLICSKELSEGFLCEAHCKELNEMLAKGTNVIPNPDWKHHCLICGKHEDRVIIDYPNCGPICDYDIQEECKKYMATNHLEEFRNIFWFGFNRPELSSDRFNDLWAELESVCDTLAGPLYSVFQSGQCKYVFASNNQLFANINNLQDFLDWCLRLVNEYREKVFKTLPHNLTEKKDQKVLLEKVQKMDCLSHLAYRAMSEIDS